MIIFLHGADTYRSRQKLKEIIDGYKKAHKSGLSLSFFEGQDFSFQDFRGQSQSMSMFREKKLIVLKNSLGNKNFKEQFLKEKDRFLRSEDIIVFFEEGALPAKDALASYLKEGADKAQEFDILSGAQLKNWIRKEFLRLGEEADPEAIEKLAREIGGDLWQMSNEISKLSNFRRGEKIAAKDVDLLVRPKIEADIFKTIDFIARKDKRSAFLLIKKHLDKGDAPMYLFSMINFQFRNLLTVKAKSQEEGSPSYSQFSVWSKELGMHPFVLKKACDQAKGFSLEDLKKIYQKIFKIDLATKTGEVSPEIALDVFIAQL